MDRESRDFRHSLESVSISANGRTYPRDSIQLIQLLQYKSLRLLGLSDVLDTSKSQLRYADTAEVVVIFDPLDATVEDGDLIRVIVHCKFPIAIEHRTVLTVGCSEIRYRSELSNKWRCRGFEVGEM